MTNKVRESLETYGVGESPIPQTSKKRKRPQDLDSSLSRASKKRSEARIEEEALTGLKRRRSETAEPKGLDKKRVKYGPVDGKKVPRMLRDLDPVIEIPREDAFPLGLQAANKYQIELIEKLGGDAEEALELSLQREEENRASTIPLKRYQEKEIEEIATTIDQKIGSQFFEIYQILESKNSAKKPEGETIIRFAKQIISFIPPKEEETSVDEAEEAPEEFVDLAKNYLSKLPVHLPEEHIKKLAQVMQKAIEKEDAQDGLSGEDENEETTVREKELETAMVRIGYLLLASQHNMSVAASCFDPNDFEQSINSLSDVVSDILQTAAERVEEHYLMHEKVAIQSKDEAAFQQLSKELANVLLLDTGSLNFGIIEMAANVLIPDRLKDTVAVDNLWLILDELAANPLLWKSIAEVKPPASKEIPSTSGIRACFGLGIEAEITRRHAQLYVLSALLGHLRQSKTGTCFATACLIKGLYYHTHYFVQDLASITENGFVTRSLFKENRNFPVQARVSKEYLDVELQVKQDGRFITTKRYDLIPDKAKEWQGPDKNSFLFEAPGVIAACQALGIKNIKEAVLIVINRMPDKFPVNEFLRQLANYAYLQQESSLYWFRSQDRYTPEEYFLKAQFAFGVQTNHPLHRGYEQVATSMVNYFGAQYMMPAWVFHALEEVLEKAARGRTLSFQRKYKLLIKELFLPMISRMRYRYNPNFDKMKKLFDDGNYGIKDSHWYGYQLCDTGLPEDFEYSTKLYEDYHNHRSYITLERFKDYAPPHRWRSVETPEKFTAFLEEVIKETADHLKEEASSAAERGEWEEVARKMQEDISKPSFTKKMIFLLLGRDSSQKKEFKKDEFNIQTTPWQFAWGGDFNEVLKTYFGFSDDPSNLKKFNGTPKEVLAKCINYIKQQPDSFKEEYVDPRNQIVISSPVHVFLLRPFEPTLKKAWQADLSTNDYIVKTVEEPGIEVANSRLNIRSRNELVSFVANNMWVTRYFEKEDWVRQQLTGASKTVFDQKIMEAEDLLDMTVDEFQKKVEQIVIESRAADPNIAKRNTPWEQRFKRVFGNLVKKLVPESSARKKKISNSAAIKLLDFARNREDTVALPESASKRFLELMKEVPFGATVKEFREELVKAAYEAHCEYLSGSDPDWKGKFCEFLDTKLFSVLPQKTKEKLLSSGIITHDTNWKDEVHDIHFIFMVNPGTGKIEMVRYTPDTQKVEFMDQSDWFPRKLKGHGYWEFPDNYRAWKGGPLFNVKKLMDI